MPHSSKTPRAPIKTCPPSPARGLPGLLSILLSRRGRGRSRLARCAVRGGGGGTSRHSGANSFDTKLIAAARAAMCPARLDAARTFIAALDLGLRKLLATAFPFYQNGMHNSEVRPVCVAKVLDPLQSIKEEERSFCTYRTLRRRRRRVRIDNFPADTCTRSHSVNSLPLSLSLSLLRRRQRRLQSKSYVFLQALPLIVTLYSEPTTLWNEMLKSLTVTFLPGTNKT